MPAESSTFSHSLLTPENKALYKYEALACLEDISLLKFKT